ncbi:MAG: HAD family hydrolase [Clostridia bacterium]|nr:HAD family hydrolase [Clostridia bacterium]
MEIKVILFDLDGTLLPMDQSEFVKAYFGLLAKKLAPYGYDPQTLIDAIWKGTGAMIKNDGSRNNEDAFWEVFQGIFGKSVTEHLPLFDEYYEKDFDRVQASCGFTPEAAETIRFLQARGMRVALATNPIFPTVATKKRIRWAGLVPEDFELITTYENSRFCKPNPAYYLDIVNTLGVKPEECVMVGNDVTEDMVTETLGMKVFLLTDCLINKDAIDISRYPHGSFRELLAFLKSILSS